MMPMDAVSSGARARTRTRTHARTRTHTHTHAHLAVLDALADFGVPKHHRLISRARPYIRAVA